MGERVTLQVYDLSQGMAKTFAPMFGLQVEAIYHTAIVVFGREYYFGGGICCDAPGQTPYGKPIRSEELGVTEIDAEVWKEYLSDLGGRFSMENYDLIEHNCNHFTNEAAEFLVGHGINPTILDQAKTLLNSPLGKQFAPLLQGMRP